MNSISPISLSDLEDQICDHCGGDSIATRFRVPGHRVVVEYNCQRCKCVVYEDLPSSFALYGSCKFIPQNMQIKMDSGWPFWREWSSRFFLNRSSGDVPIKQDLSRVSKTPLFLHCLDPIFGHSLKRLLHLSIYEREFPDHDIVPIIPHWLESYLPEAVKGAISVTWAGSFRYQWLDELDKKMAEILGRWRDVAFCQTMPSIASEHFSIEKFSKVRPYERVRRSYGMDRLKKITFIWRDARCWHGGSEAQKVAFAQIAERVRGKHKNLEVVLAGVSHEHTPNSWPGEIVLLKGAGAEDEMRLNRIYSTSDLVIGMHGSNMLLPSAHAGAVIELVPKKRWHNSWTASLFRADADAAENAFYHRFLPAETSIEDISEVADSILGFGPRFQLLSTKTKRKNQNSDSVNLDVEFAATLDWRP